jgi:hypothetical protein
MSVAQRIANWREEFIARHGGPDACISIKGGSVGMTYFPDGARCKIDPMGEVFEPPEDETARTKLILMYWTEKLRRAENAHGELRKMVHGTFVDRLSYIGPGYLGDEETAAEQLEESKRIVMKTRRKVASIQKQLDELLGTAEKEQEDHEYERRQQQRQDRMLKRLNDTRI